MDLQLIFRTFGSRAHFFSTPPLQGDDLVLAICYPSKNINEICMAFVFFCVQMKIKLRCVFVNMYFHKVCLADILPSAGPVSQHTTSEGNTG